MHHLNDPHIEPVNDRDRPDSARALGELWMREEDDVVARSVQIKLWKLRRGERERGRKEGRK